MLWEAKCGLPATQYNPQGGTYTFRLTAANEAEAIELARDIFAWPEHDPVYQPTFIKVERAELMEGEKQ